MGKVTSSCAVTGVNNVEACDGDCLSDLRASQIRLAAFGYAIEMHSWIQAQSRVH